jgi:hypothetical protein
MSAVRKGARIPETTSVENADSVQLAYNAAVRKLIKSEEATENGSLHDAPYFSRAVLETIGQMDSDLAKELKQKTVAAIEDYFRSITEATIDGGLPGRLRRLGVKNQDVLDLARAERRVLASLYLEAIRATPRPGQLKLLAIQFALDPRRPLGTNPSEYAAYRTDLGWSILAAKDAPLFFAMRMVRVPSEIRIYDTDSCRILALALSKQLRKQPLLRYIEKKLGKVPTRQDAQQDKRKDFQFSVHELDNGQRRVTLWINGSQVELPNHDDVHNFLHALCEAPEAGLTGPDMKAKYGVTNASQAARLIRNALDETQSGASRWLQSRPFQWRADFAPRCRRGRQSGPK